MSYSLFQPKPAGKRKKQKTSLVKLSNKRLGKLAKQGKLKKKLRKKDIHRMVSQRVNPEEAPPTVTDANADPEGEVG